MGNTGKGYCYFCKFEGAKGKGKGNMGKGECYTVKWEVNNG